MRELTVHLLFLDVPAEIPADVEELAQFLRLDVHPSLLRSTSLLSRVLGSPALYARSTTQHLTIGSPVLTALCAQISRAMPSRGE